MHRTATAMKRGAGSSKVNHHPHCSKLINESPAGRLRMNRDATVKRGRDVLTVNCNNGREKSAMDAFYLLTLPANG